MKLIERPTPAEIARVLGYDTHQIYAMNPEFKINDLDFVYAVPEPEPDRYLESQVEELKRMVQHRNEEMERMRAEHREAMDKSDRQRSQLSAAIATMRRDRDRAVEDAAEATRLLAEAVKLLEEAK